MLLVVNMKPIVGESNWLVFRDRLVIVEQAAPRFDRSGVPGVGGRRSRVLGVHGQRFGVALVNTNAGRPDGRQRVFNVVVVIVEAIPEAVVMADQRSTPVVVGNVR